MILEELQSEINKRSNELVIEYVTKLLERDLEEWFLIENIDKSLAELVLSFKWKLRQYVDAKLKHHRMKRIDPIRAENEDYQWRCMRVEKNDIKKKLIEEGVNYKKYQRQ